MYVKPRSHQFGTLEIGENKFDIADERVSELDEKCVELEYGQGIIFNNFLVHRSGVITQKGGARMSVQIRFDDLDDVEYSRRGWPQNYRIVDAVDTMKFPDLPV